MPIIAPNLWLAGTLTGSTAGSTPPLPTGWEVDDIFLLLVETANEVVAQPSGWTECPGSPQGIGTAASTTATRLTAFWRRAQAGDTAPSLADAGDHTIARIFAIQGAIRSGVPFKEYSGTTAAASTAVSCPGITTTVDESYVINIVATGFDGTSTAQMTWNDNSDLVNLSSMAFGEYSDGWNAAGNGGGFSVAAGAKRVLGSVAASTGTLVNSFAQALLTLAVLPLTDGPDDVNGQWLDPLEPVAGGTGGMGFGLSCDISGDGRVIAVGAMRNDYGWSPGHVYVYYGLTGRWPSSKRLLEPVSTQYGRIGTTVRVSKDGSHVFAGNGMSNYGWDNFYGGVTVWKGDDYEEAFQLCGVTLQRGGFIDIDDAGHVVLASSNTAATLATNNQLYLWGRDPWDYDALVARFQNAASYYWGLQDTTGATAVDTQGNLDAAYVGSPTIGQDAYVSGNGPEGIGKYVSLSSGKYIRLGYQGVVGNSPSHAFRVGIWFRTSSTAGDQVLWSEKGSSGTNIFEIVMSAAGMLTMTVNADGWPSSYSVSMTDAVNDGKWHFLSAIGVGPSWYYLRLHVDGRRWYSGSTQTDQSTIVFSDPSLQSCIGTDPRDTSRHWDGDVSRVFVIRGAGLCSIAGDTTYYGIDPTEELMASAGWGWGYYRELKSSRTHTGNYWGSHTDVSPDGTVIVVGAPGTAAATYPKGFVSVFSGSRWGTETILEASDGVNGDHFGDTVVISADNSVILIGASYYSTQTGKLYVRYGTNWASEVIIPAGLSGAGLYPRWGSAFQMSYPTTPHMACSADGSVIVVSAYMESTQNPALLYVYSGANWATQTILTPPDTLNNGYGFYSMWINAAGTKIVAAWGNASGTGTPRSSIGTVGGEAYRWDLVAGTWTLARRWSPHSDALADDDTGWNVYGSREALWPLSKHMAYSDDGNVFVGPVNNYIGTASVPATGRVWVANQPGYPAEPPVIGAISMERHGMVRA